MHFGAKGQEPSTLRIHPAPPLSAVMTLTSLKQQWKSPPRHIPLQGKFSNQRRNYSSLWQQMTSRRDELNSGYAKTLLRVNILGKGQDDRLAMPPELTPLVSIYRRLAFRGFYDTLHHSFAILPLLGSPRYLTDKFSSSILSSLISGTPLIADAVLLTSYSMLNEQSVYLQRPGESELDVMLRIIATPAEELLVIRRQILETRRRVNGHVTDFFAGLLSELCQTSGSEGKRVIG